MWNLVSIRLKMLLVSLQDSSIGPETVLDAPMVLLGDEAQV